MSWPRAVGAVLVAATFVGTVGCFAPTSNTERLTDAARELNLSARFGRLELAASHAAPAVRQDFLARRAQWGESIRVLDVELASLDIDDDAGEALVEVDVSWILISESTLRGTRIAQQWKEMDGDWLLTREKRVSGDIGLFGEQVETPAQRPDVHFSSKTIR